MKSEITAPLELSDEDLNLTGGSRDAEQWHGFLSDVAIWKRRLVTDETNDLTTRSQPDA